MTLSAAAVLAVGLSACGDNGTETQSPAVTVPAGPTSTQDGGAAGSAAPGDTEAPTPETTESTSDDDGADETSEAAQTGAAGSLEDAADARNQALELVNNETGGQGVVIDQERDDDGKWEIDVLVDNTVHDVEIRDGQAKLDGTDDADDDDRAAAAAKVTIDDAIKAALEHTPGTLKDASWDDDDHGRWEIDVRRDDNKDVELYVDANTGAVTVD